MTEQRHVLLVGLPGAGKTSVGRRLGKELKRPFADVDEQVELHVGRCIPQIFVDDGEEAFRRWEGEVLANLLERSHPLVVAAGGGTVMRPTNQSLARKRSFVVWLRASPEFLVSRTDTTHRPLLATDDPDAVYQRLATERAAVYAEVADATVDVEMFHGLANEEPKKAVARHIAELVSGG